MRNVLAGPKSRHDVCVNLFTTTFRKKLEINPILSAQAGTIFTCPMRGQVRWEEKDVFNPGAVVKDGKVWLLYRAEDTVGMHFGTSRIGLAWSENGETFERHPEPVMYPDHDDMEGYEWEGGCEDPRVVEHPDGGYVMTYTAFDGEIARLAVATSPDLWKWTKHGLAFADSPSLWSKSGAIVTEIVDGRMVAKRLQGKFWMIWGESSLFLATSDDMLKWEIVLHAPPSSGGGREEYVGYPEVVLETRAGRADSYLVEPGPPLVWSEDGIAMLYNASNAMEGGDPNRPPRAYSGFRALLDSVDPSAVIGRTVAPFFVAEQPYEMNGQINNVIFLEGLVRFQERWWLYYGTADSHIAVASTDN